MLFCGFFYKWKVNNNNKLVVFLPLCKCYDNTKIKIVIIILMSINEFFIRFILHNDFNKFLQFISFSKGINQFFFCFTNITLIVKKKIG